MGRRDQRGWIDLVERAYELDEPETEWLTALASAAPFPDEGPIAIYAFELSGRSLELTTRAMVDGEDIAWMLGIARGLPEEVWGLNLLVRSNQIFGSMSETLFTKFPAFAPGFKARMQGKYADTIGCIARDGRDAGMVMTKILVEPRSSTPAERRRWARVAAHMGAGLRLRRRLESLSLDDDNVEAVLEADGSVTEARAAAKAASAREALREAATRIDRARSHARAEPDEALELWQGLVSGRWSMVDHFDTDGRRYLVAHRNDIAAGDPRGLTPREQEVAELVGIGESGKAISYRLGISEAAVSAAVANAILKLGLGGRAELAAFFAPTGPRWRLTRFDLAGEPMLLARSAGLNRRRLRRLTEAERHVALDLLSGRTNEAIARERGSSLSTVANQIGSIFDKLGVTSRVELAVALNS